MNDTRRKGSEYEEQIRFQKATIRDELSNSNTEVKYIKSLPKTKQRFNPVQITNKARYLSG